VSDLVSFVVKNRAISGFILTLDIKNGTKTWAKIYDMMIARRDIAESTRTNTIG